MRPPTIVRVLIALPVFTIPPQPPDLMVATDASISSIPLDCFAILTFPPAVKIPSTWPVLFAEMSVSAGGERHRLRFIQQVASYRNITSRRDRYRCRVLNRGHTLSGPESAEMLPFT